MTLPANLTTGTVTGTLLDTATGAPLKGSVTFTPDAQLLLNRGGATTHAAITQTVLLDKKGTFSVALIATDNADILPSGWTWRIDFHTNPPVAGFSFPLASGVSVDIATLVPTPGSRGEFMFDAISDSMVASAINGPGTQSESQVLAKIDAHLGGDATNLFSTIDGKVDAVALDGLVDSRLGGDSTGLVGKVAINAADILKRAPKLEFYPGGDVPTPWVIAHRGGLALYPESSILGYDAAARDGFPLETDVQTLADGRLVCIHDLTVDRTMSGVTGPVSSVTSEQWRNAKIKPAWPGGATSRPLFFDDFLARYGGRAPLIIELKAGTAPPVIDAITKRGLEKAVVMQSSTYADCQQFVAAGIPTMLLFSPSITTITPDPATILADGIRYVGVPTGMPTAQIQAAAAAGLKVVVYTVNTRADLDATLAKGAIGVFSDDPWYVSNRINYQTGPDLASGTGWPGMRPRTGSGLSSTWKPVLTPTGIESYQYSAVGGNVLQTLDLPQLGMLTRGTLTVAFRVHFYPEAGVQTANIGFYLWQNATGADAQFIDGANPGQNGFTVLARRNGVLGAYKYVDGGAALSIGASTATTEFAPAGKLGTVDVRVKFTPTQITLDASNGTSLVIADTFTVSNMRFGLRWVGTDGAVSDLRVTQQ